MNWFRNRKTVTKLMIGFGLIAAMLAFVGYRGLTASSMMNTMLNTMYERDLTGLSSIKEANIDLIYIGRGMRAAILADDKAEVERNRAFVDKSITLLNTNLAVTEKTIVTDEGKRTFAQIKTWLSEYYPQVTEVMRVVQAGDLKTAKDLVVRARAVADRLDDALTDLANSKTKLAEQAFKESDVIAASTQNMLMTIG